MGGAEISTAFTSRVVVATHFPDRSFLRVPGLEASEPTARWDSAEILRRVREPWFRPCDAAYPAPIAVYNFDGEMDDFSRLEEALHERQKLPPSQRPKLVVVAGEQKRGKETFRATVRTCELSLGAEFIPRTDDHFSSADGTCVVLRGAPISTAHPSQAATQAAQAQCRSAATRLEEELGDSRFIFHNNTSSVLFSSLREETIQKCSAYTNTCTHILGENKWIVGANIGFDEPSHAAALGLCERAGIPYVHVHGSTMGFTCDPLNGLPEAVEVLDIPAADPEQMRGEIRFLMQKHLEWTGRILGGVSGKTGADLVELIKSKAVEGTVKYGVSMESISEWLGPATSQDTYTEEACKLAQACNRLDPLGLSINCPLSNTLGDYAAIFFDTPNTPEELRLIPFSMIESGTELIPLSEQSVEYFATGVPEQALIERFQAQRQRHKRQSSSAGAEHIVNRALAKEWQVFTNIAACLHQSVLQELEAFKGDGIDAVLKTKIRGASTYCLRNLSNGRMTRLAENALASAS